MSTKGKGTIPSSELNTSDPLTSALREEMIINEINKNLSQDLIVTTKDKVRLVVYKNYPVDRWTGPLSILCIFLTFLIPLLTADFHNFLSIKGSIWKHIFFDCTVFVTLFLVRSLWLAWKRPSCEDLVTQISGTFAGSVNKKRLYQNSHNQPEVPDSSEQREAIDEVM